MITDTMTYQKRKLYRLSEYLDNLTTKATSVFCNELEQTQAITKLCKINNTIERILSNEK
tara:strand:- start:560 stop:739 length:180 start_codon:yes stop_codon:yes gene_type:complete